MCVFFNRLCTSSTSKKIKWIKWQPSMFQVAGSRFGITYVSCLCFLSSKWRLTAPDSPSTHLVQGCWGGGNASPFREQETRLQILRWDVKCSDDYSLTVTLTTWVIKKNGPGLIKHFSPLEAQMFSPFRYQFYLFYQSKLRGGKCFFLVSAEGCEDYKGIFSIGLWADISSVQLHAQSKVIIWVNSPRYFFSNFFSDSASRLSLVLQYPHQCPFKSRKTKEMVPLKLLMIEAF